MSVRLNRYGQAIGPAIAHWTSRPRPTRARLLGRYCRLEPVNLQRHGADLYTAYMRAPDDRDWTYLFDERPERREEFDAYITKLASSEDPLHFAIIESHSESALGTAALLRIDAVHGSIEVGAISFSPRPHLDHGPGVGAGALCIRGVARSGEFRRTRPTEA